MSAARGDEAGIFIDFLRLVMTGEGDRQGDADLPCLNDAADFEEPRLRKSSDGCGSCSAVESIGIGRRVRILTFKRSAKINRLKAITHAV